MFRAAEGVGTATRPLLVFYGLSQAGRAIAAAASAITTADGWRLEGHGIRTVSKTLSGPLPDVLVASDKGGSRGSFVRLSEILDSPLFADKVNPLALNALWDCLPENRVAPLRDTGTSRRTPLYVAHLSLNREPHPLASAPVAYFPPWVVSSPEGGQTLVDYLAAFSDQVREFHSFVRVGHDPDAAPDFSSHHDGWGELRMNWILPHQKSGTFAERVKHLRSIGRTYDGDIYFFPAVGDAGQGRGLHPLMSWWAVLHTLSMLARYQPAEWAEQIDVDGSSYAAPVESLLKRAMQVVPRLVRETIEEVA